MTIPKYEELMRPLLAAYASGAVQPIQAVRAQLATEFELSDEELAERLPSGTAKTFANRVGWAAFYLSKTLALDRVGRGAYRITPRGSQLLADYEAIDRQVLATFPEFAILVTATTSGDKSADAVVSPSSIAPTDATPEELMAGASKQLNDAVVAQIRQRIAGGTPEFFEQLVTDVMVAMGYGGSHAEAAERLGKSGDGGVDGVIREDRLGLDVIYLQAKRWEATVGRPEIQKFVGALQGHHATRGVFITSSSFSKDARTYVDSVSSRVVLVDGVQLAQLMIDHGVGVSVRHSYSVLRVDEGYFEEEELA